MKSLGTISLGIFSILGTTLGLCFAPPSPAQPDADGGEPRLEEITVTANRREESLRDTPMAVSAIGGDALEDIGASSFSDYFRNIPGLSITDRGPGRNNITIRGVTVDAQEGQIPTTAIYIDESPITGQFSNTDLRVYDIERVEVLRGPQGTLYGSTALGGAVRFITKKADPNEFEAYLDARYETISSGGTGFSINGAVNFPLVEDRLGLRISAYSDEEPGFIDNFGAVENFLAAADPQPVKRDIGGAETEGARLSLLWNVTDSFTATLGYVYQDTQGNGQPDVETVSGLAQFDPGTFEDIGILPVPAAQQTRIEALAAFAVGDESLNDKMSMPNLSLLWSTARWGDFSYNYTDLDHSFRRDRLIDNNNPFADQNLRLVFFEDFVYNNEAHELRWVSSQERRLRWVLGMFREDNETSVNVRAITDPPWIQQRSPSNPQINEVLQAIGLPENYVEFTDENFGLKQTAFYGELTVDITNQMQITGGIRTSKWKQGGYNGFGLFGDTFYDGNDLEGLTPADAAAVDPEQYGFSESAENNPFIENNVTIGKLNIAYRPFRDTLFFARWSEGFRLVELGVNTIDNPSCLTGGEREIPGLNGQNLNPVQLPDDLTNYEFGVKHTFGGGRASANVGVYKIEWKNIQFEGELPNNCGGVLPNGDAEIQGVEFELSALLADNWQIAFNGAFTSGEVTRVPELVREDGATIPTDVVDVLGANVGTRMAGTPKIQFSLTSDYTWPRLLGNFDGNLNANYVYTEAVTNNLNERRIPGLRGSQILGDNISQLNLGLTLEREGLSMKLYVHNVFDSIQSAFSTVNVLETRRLYNVIRPRTIGIGVRKGF